MKYRINWNYRTGRRGPWVADDEIDLTDADAAAIQADSPGVLSPVVDVPAPAPRAVDAPSHDRMYRAPGRKRTVGEG